MRYLIAVLLIATTISGCGMRRVENVQTPYVAREYSSYGRPGTASIVGSVVERSLAGASMTCAGMDVTLMPATALTREAMDIVRAGQVPSTRALEEDPARLRATMKSSTCDDAGNFKFDGLAAGAWILLVELRKSDSRRMAGTMIREFELAEGESATITFTDEEYAP